MTGADLPTVDPTEVGDDLLLDVREDDEWEAGRAPGAVHLPMSQLQARLAEVPADRPVAVVCQLRRPLGAGDGVPGGERPSGAQRRRAGCWRGSGSACRWRPTPASSRVR